MSHQLMQHGPLDPISNRAQGPKSKIRIAYAVGWLRNAGTEGQLLELLRHLDRSQFDPFLILMENAGAQKAEALVNESFVMGVSLGGSSRWLLRSFSFAEAIFRTSRCLRRWRCDVVHAFLPGPSILAGAAARLAKTPVVIGSRRSLPSHYRSRRSLARWADTAALHFATYSLGNSNAVVDEMISVAHCPPSKCGTILNGVDTERFRPDFSSGIRKRLSWTNGEIVFGLVGNFRECKRHADFVTAANLILKTHPEARFLMAGSDLGTREAIERQIHGLGLEDKVRVFESSSTPETIFAAVDVCVCASTTEGLSNTILEAMACGKPVIATNVGGNPEAVSHGQSGIIIPPQSPEAIATAADALIADPDLRMNLGLNARKRAVEQFSLHAMVSAHEQLYLRLAAKLHSQDV